MLLLIALPLAANKLLLQLLNLLILLSHGLELILLLRAVFVYLSPGTAPLTTHLHEHR